MTLKCCGHDAAVVYHLRPRRAGTRLLEVHCHVCDPDPAGQVFSLPVWIPGSYMIRDFARHVVAIDASAAGEPVALRKTGKSIWRAAPVDAALVVRMEIYASDPSVRGACLDPDGMFFNGSSVFLRVHGREREPCTLHISPGDDPVMETWQVATSLDRLTGNEGEYGAFSARGYDELIDHPVLAGSLARVDFEAGGVPHAMLIAGRHEADLGRLAGDLARICSWQMGFFGGPFPVARYLFLVRLTGGGCGGLEHRASSALVCHRNHLPRTGRSGGDAEYRRFLGLVSHEYLHLWNGKRIRPLELVDPDLDREAFTRQLWLVEGVTSYYDDLALLRSGLVTTTEYLEILGRLLTSVYRTAGRRRQTLEEASFDAWIKHYRPDENSPNAHISYYTKGAMVALALDLEMRLRTEGRVSLDDVMRVLWRNYGVEPGHGLPEGAFEELAAEVSGLDLGDFFRANLRSTVDPPIGILLAQFGIRMAMRAPEAQTQAGARGGNSAPGAWLGMQLRREHGRVRVAHILDGGPAQESGILVDDELIAIDGLRFDHDQGDVLLARLGAGRPVPVHFFRRDELLRAELVPVEPPRDTCHLSVDPQATEIAVGRRRQWLGSGD
jgi:predicted metalloprotease with PDZ domain